MTVQFDDRYEERRARARAVGAVARETHDAAVAGASADHWTPMTLAHVLEVAIEAGEPEIFATHVRWAYRYSVARDLATASLDEQLRRWARRVASGLDERDGEAVEAIVEIAASTMTDVRPSEGLRGEHIDRYVAAAIAGDRREALDAATAVAVRSGRAAALRLVAAAQQLVGDAWERDELSVADEHVASLVSLHVVSVLASLDVGELPRSGRRGRVIVVAPAPERHEIPARLVAEALDADGWLVRDLGAEVPLSSILDAVRRHRPAVLALSATMVDTIPAIAQLALNLDDMGSERPLVLVGGAALRDTGDLWRRLGADAYAPDLDAAVSAARDASVVRAT